MNKCELFNLRHASARNVIEQIFGVLKRRFRILLLAPEYSLEIQARIPAALCALHNFIRKHDPKEGELPDNHQAFNFDAQDNPTSVIGGGGGEDRTDASIRRDQIAQAMWDDYLRVCAERALENDEEEVEDFIDDDDDEDFI